MSGEKVSGIAFEHAFLNPVRAHMRTAGIPCYVEDLHADWGALFLDDYYLQHESSLALLAQLSATLPLLHFYHTEDFCWGFRLFSQGTQLASIHVDEELWLVIADQLAPHGTWTDASHNYDGVIQTPEFLAAYQAQFAHRNVAAFALFHLAPAMIEQLEILLSGNHPGDDFLDMDEFRNVLGLSALRYRSYRRYQLDEADHDAEYQEALASGRLTKFL